MLGCQSIIFRWGRGSSDVPFISGLLLLDPLQSIEIAFLAFQVPSLSQVFIIFCTHS